MMNKIFKIIAAVIIVIFIFSCNMTNSIKEDGLYAYIKTSMGNFLIKFNYEEAPITVGNFIALSSGEQEFADPKTGETVKKPFYDGLIFHRIIKNKIIQGGCPIGNGAGNPGYSFVDELSDSLRFDSAGIMAMANSGSNTNGSQFFITLAPIPSLYGKYTVFGKVIDGMKTIEKINNVKIDEKNKPYKDVYIKEIKIIRKGDKAKSFNALEEFNSPKNKENALKKNLEIRSGMAKEFLKSLGVDENKLITARTGLKYFILNNGKGIAPVKGDKIVANYAGYLEDGTKFDSSYDRNTPIEMTIGIGQVIQGWDEALLAMHEGEKRILIIPPKLGYGESGMPPAIPPQSTLIFEVELISVKKQ